MNAIKLFAVALIIAGVLALTYGGFSYTKKTQEIQVGSMALSLDETKTVNFPLWLGIGAIGIGALLLLVGDNKK